MGEIIFSAFAAGGVLLLLWVLLGLVLLPASGGNLFCVMTAEGAAKRMEKNVRAFRWLQQSGLTNMRLVIVDCGLDEAARQEAVLLVKQTDGAMFCAQSELTEILQGGKD